MAEIHFFDEGSGYKLPDTTAVIGWLKRVCREESVDIQAVNYIFCTDEHLLGMNKEFLGHWDYTDIITFPYHEPGEMILGDCYISTDRVRDNAKRYNASFHKELHRVIVHGLLHLIGYKDHTNEEKKLMREKEDYYLTRLTN